MPRRQAQAQAQTPVKKAAQPARSLHALTPRAPNAATKPAQPAVSSPKPSPRPSQAVPALPRPPAPPEIDCATSQTDELASLEAIYSSDFSSLTSTSAWNRTVSRSFTLTLRSLSDQATYVVLAVSLPEIYPRTVPQIDLTGFGKVRQNERAEIERLVATRPRELVGEVMIYTIASEIEEVLERAVEEYGGEQTASFMQQRTDRAVQSKEAERKREEEERERIERERGRREEEIVRMVKREVTRRKVKSEVGAAPAAGTVAAGNAGLELERPITVDRLTFSHISVPVLWKRGPLTTVFVTQPVTGSQPASFAAFSEAEPETDSSRPKIAIKKMKITGSAGLQELEVLLSSLRKVRSESILSILDYSVTSTGPSAYSVSVFLEFARHGSLFEVLQTGCELPVAKTRAWTLELLDALAFLHKRRITHGRVHVRNVLFQPISASLSVRLSDVGWKEKAYAVHNGGKPEPGGRADPHAFRPWPLPEGNAKASSKTDVWDLGTVFAQMLFGLSAVERAGSVRELDDQGLSPSLRDLLQMFFQPEPAKRAGATDILVAEFLRDDCPVRVGPAAAQPVQVAAVVDPAYSRYATDWIELGRLGKGGYGEVMKARNRVDNGVYAIKKIVGRLGGRSELAGVLSEAHLLAQVNHQNVVRYYSAWIEKGAGGRRRGPELTSEEDDSDSDSGSGSDSDSATNSVSNTASDSTSLAATNAYGLTSLDFVSTSYGLSNVPIVFGDDTNSRSSPPSGSSSGSQTSVSAESEAATVSPTHAVLYIQMEYCPQNTLRHLIQSAFFGSSDSRWGMLRRVLHGLSYIHSHGIIHRDLKPDNIFIDASNQPKIGDFGLATTSHISLPGRAGTDSVDQFDTVTHSIGTTLYAAPEVKSSAGVGSYTEKIDMFSLGIIFFEMCYPLRTGMERDSVLRRLRAHELPADFDQAGEMPVERRIVSDLTSHIPANRPSCDELLEAADIPRDTSFKSMDEVVSYVADQAGFHQFASLWMQRQARASAGSGSSPALGWDLNAKGKPIDAPSTDTLVLEQFVRHRLSALFHRHCAVEVARPHLFPASPFYEDNFDVVTLADNAGNYLQLPYDLTLPHARLLATQRQVTERSYTFGTVFRKPAAGLRRHHANGETDFDIVTTQTEHNDIADAEIIHLLDELIAAFPCLRRSQMAVQLNTAGLLDLVLEFCRVERGAAGVVRKWVGKLNFRNWTWKKIKSQLRARLDVPATVLDGISQFAFAEPARAAFERLTGLFRQARPDLRRRLEHEIEQLGRVVSAAARFGVRTAVLVAPLSNFHSEFYDLMIQCVDTKKRDIVAAGGRYDKLIQHHRPAVKKWYTPCYAVGLNIATDKLCMLVESSESEWQPGFISDPLLLGPIAPVPPSPSHRGDVLISSYDPASLSTVAPALLSQLWTHNFSAQLTSAPSADPALTSAFTYHVVLASPIEHTAKSYLELRSRATFPCPPDTQLCSPELVPYLRAERGEAGGIAALDRAIRRRKRVRVLDGASGKVVAGKRSAVEAALARIDEGPAAEESYGAHIVAYAADSDGLLDRLGRPGPGAVWWDPAAVVEPGSEPLLWPDLRDLFAKWRNSWVQAGPGPGPGTGGDGAGAAGTAGAATAAGGLPTASAHHVHAHQHQLPAAHAHAHGQQQQQQQQQQHQQLAGAGAASGAQAGAAGEDEPVSSVVFVCNWKTGSVLRFDLSV